MKKPTLKYYRVTSWGPGTEDRLGWFDHHKAVGGEACITRRRKKGRGGRIYAVWVMGKELRGDNTKPTHERITEDMEIIEKTEGFEL